MELHKLRIRRVLVLISLLLCGAAFAQEADPHPSLSQILATQPKSYESWLTNNWQAYRQQFVEANGRVIEPGASFTTSEAVGHAMLISVFMKDKKTLDSIWSWAEENMANDKRPNYGPFAWKVYFANNPEGARTLYESATDADQDIILALVLAHFTWSDPKYLSRSLELLDRLWDLNTVEVKGERYVTAGDWASKLASPRLNPSYCAPYAYRIFACVDKKHDWNKVVDSSYKLLKESAKVSRLGLPPDWCNVNKEGVISVNPYSSDAAYSYEAMRIPWRIALDYQWSGDKRASETIESLKFLLDSWRLTKTINAGYSPTGVLVKSEEPLPAVACALPAIKYMDRSAANEIVKLKLLPRFSDNLYSPAKIIYNNSWSFFSVAAYSEQLEMPKRLSSLVGQSERSQEILLAKGGVATY